MTAKTELLYEGKAKKVYRTSDPDLYLMEFKDDATAFNGAKKGSIRDKGYFNAQISAFFFKKLAEGGLPNHFVSLVGDREMLVKSMTIIPVEVVVRNIVAGSLAGRLGLDEGTTLARPVLEFYYKSDSLGDPMINSYHMAALELVDRIEREVMEGVSLEVNLRLRALLKKAGIELVDFKLEFGRHQGKVYLGDEISPDTCRFWDISTGEKLDKDRFRRDLGGVEEAYQEVWRRLQGLEAV